MSVFRSGYEHFSTPDEPADIFEAADYTDYYYSQLTLTQKQAYTAVRQQVYDFPKSIKVPSLDSESLEKVLTALICDNPYMFMFNSCSLVTVGSKNYFEPKYIMSRQEYELQKEQTDIAVDKIISSLPVSASSYEKQLILHDSIVNNCTYFDTDEPSQANVTGVFINAQAKCTGYAKAYKLLLNKAGIDCVLISGYAEDYNQNGSSHMWVATDTDGIWSYTDITWDDPITDNGEEICQHVYFCMSDDMINRTHSEYEFLNSCPDSQLYYYKAGNAYYNDYNKDTLDNIALLISSSADCGSNQVEFMFADSQLLSDAEKALFEQQEIYKALKSADKQCDKKIVTAHVQYRINYDINLITLFFEIKD